MCASLAHLAARVNSLNGSDIYRTHDLVETVEEWRQATVWRYASALCSIPPARGDVDVRMGARGREVLCGTMTLALLARRGLRG